MNPMWRAEKAQNAMITAKGIESSAVKSQIHSAISRAYENAGNFSKTVDEIQRREELSPIGKQEEILKAKDAAKGELKKLAQQAEGYNQESLKLLDSLESIKPENETLDYMKQMEIRNRLHTMEHSEVLRLYMQDIRESKYSDLVAALENDPLPLSFIGDQSRAMSQRNRLARSFPEKAALLKDHEIAVEVLNRTAHDVYRVIGKYQ